jgi:hypothetical protein
MPGTEPQTYTLDLENKGLLISRPGDVLPAGYFPDLLNMTADKTGYIGSRGGTVKANATNLGSSVHSQGRIIVQGTAYTYQGAGTSLYRAWSSIATGFSGNPLIMRDGGPDLSVLPFEIIWDSNVRYKDNGTALTNFGIAGPMAMASAVAATTLTKTIDLFEYANNGAIQAAWPTSNATVTTTTTNPYQGTYAGNLAVNASTTGYMTLTSAMDLSKFVTAGDSTLDDFIVIAFRVDTAANITEVRLEFDVDPSTNDFAHNYYWKSVTTNVANAATVGTQTAAQAYQTAINLAALQINPTDLAALQFFFPDLPSNLTAAQLKSLAASLNPSELTTGTSQWLQIFTPKNGFTRVGTSANNWANVAAVRIQVQTNAGGSVNFGMDDLIMQSGNNLNASNYEWIYQYRNALTDTTSPLSPTMAATISVTNANATVTVRNPRDTQVTHIDLFRRGGNNSIFSFSTEKVVSSWSGTTTITDSVADQNLGDPAQLTPPQVELANLLQTPGQTCTSCQLTANSGASYTDDTSAVSDDSQATYANLSNMTNVAGGGWLLIGADAQFRQILTVMDANVNTNASVLTVQYWNGAAWYAAPNALDGTAVGGKTLAVGGTIEFDLPGDWAQSTANSITAYYIRLSVSATLSAAVHLTEVRVGANAFDPVTMEIFSGRLWSNDTRHTDRVWYSERFTPEIFYSTDFVARSRSGDPIVRPFGLDDQLFVYSGQTVDRLIGSDSSSFQLIPTGSEVGLFSTYACCRARSQLYSRAHGGIYAMPGSGFSTKISLAINPLFGGFNSPDGLMFGIDNTKASTEAMEFYGSRIYFAYTDINGNRQEITYDLDLDRWEPSDRPATSYLRLDNIGQFWSGNSDGYVYQRNTGNTDNGQAISVRFSTPYIDFGAQSVSKQITEIAIDCDLQGATLAFQANLDNGLGVQQTISLTNSGGRGIVYMPLADDTQCRNVSLALVSNNGGVNVKFYKITFFYIPLASLVTKLPTDWDDLGYPGDKRLRQLQLEIDTQGAAASVAVQVDNVTTQTLTAMAGTRAIIPFSLNKDTIGKLTRLIISSATPFRYYVHQFEFQADPLQMTRYDTIELDFGYTRWKAIRRMWIAAQTPNTISIQIYIDEVLRYTSAAISITSASGWTKYELRLPPGLKGMVFRFIITSSALYKIFMDQSDVEWKPLAADRGYDRAPLQGQQFLPAQRQR